MINTKTVYVSGDWVVTPGREEEFVSLWAEFLGWTRSAFAELGSARLIRDDDNPRHFVSFASWNSIEAMLRWRSGPEFAARFSACRAACDDFRGSSYGLMAEV